MTREKTHLCTFSVQVTQETELLSQYDSFTENMVLKRLFIGDPEEETMHVYCSHLLEDRALSQYDGFTQQMFMKRLFMVNTGEDCMFVVQIFETKLQVDTLVVPERWS